jgi:hypothetical protein
MKRAVPEGVAQANELRLDGQSGLYALGEGALFGSAIHLRRTRTLAGVNRYFILQDLPILGTGKPMVLSRSEGC